MDKLKVLLIDDVRNPEFIPNPHGSNNEPYKNVTIARNAEEGIERLKEQKWDVLLLDHDMGYGKNGMDVLRFLEDPDNHKHMPKRIYLVTANVVERPKMLAMLKKFWGALLIEEYGAL